MSTSSKIPSQFKRINIKRINKSTPYVYLLPHCNCVCVAIMWRKGWISEAQTPCCAYMNIIPEMYVWQKFCLNLLCTGFPIKCVKLKPCGPLFVCTEWITCSQRCLVLRLWHTLKGIAALNEFGPLSSISIRAVWAFHYF